MPNDTFSAQMEETLTLFVTWNRQTCESSTFREKFVSFIDLPYPGEATTLLYTQEAVTMPHVYHFAAIPKAESL
jgi:hypothetical protein